MTPNNSLVPVVNFQCGADVTKEDIVAIRVSAFEQNQLAIVEESKLAIAENEKALNAYKTEEQQVVKKAVDADAKPLLKLAKHLEAFKAGPITAAASSGTYVLEQGTGKPLEVSYSVSYMSKSGQDFAPKSKVAITTLHSIPVPARVHEIKKEVVRLTQDNDFQAEKGSAAKQQLTQLPAMERAARAKIAETFLSKTDQGRALLKDLK